MMSGFWSNVFAGTLGAVLSAAAMAAIGELQPLGLHWIIPEDAVIPMSGQCPSGWRQYDAASGQYILAPVDTVSRSHSQAPTAELVTPYLEAASGVPKSARGPMSLNRAQRLVLPAESGYIILSLCQRR
jgi:hypothetical protein